jgi:hypothetical protein
MRYTKKFFDPLSHQVIESYVQFGVIDGRQLQREQSIDIAHVCASMVVANNMALTTMIHTLQ